MRTMTKTTALHLIGSCDCVFRVFRYQYRLLDEFWAEGEWMTGVKITYGVLDIPVY
jgi:hypothetical protein